MKKYILLLIVSSSIFQLSAQMPLGSFKAYLPYHTFIDVAVSKNIVYGATKSSLMLVDKTDGESLSQWSKVDGLSEVGIQCIAYSDDADVLIVAYTNSNIDVIRNQKLTNISDIKNKQMSGSKNIHSITIFGKTAYISCDFGVVLLNLESLLIEDTWFTIRGSENYSALETVFFEDHIYISTSKGIFHTLKGNYNIANFASWQKVEELGDIAYKNMLAFNSKLLVVKNDERSAPDSAPKDTLLFFENGTWQKMEELPVGQIYTIDARGDELLICDFYYFCYLDRELNTTGMGMWSEHLSRPSKAKLDDDYVWIADRYLGLACYFREHHYARMLTDGGPVSEMTASLDYADGVLAIVPGTRTNFAPAYTPPSVSWMKNDQWEYNNNYKEHENARDFTRVAINPTNTSEFYVASWAGGLFKFKDGTVVTQYNHRNAPFDTISIDGGAAIRLSAIDFDRNGNLWIANGQDGRPLKKLDKDGNFTTYRLRYGSYDGDPEHLLVDSRNQIWITYPRANSLVVFKEGSNNSANSEACIDMNSAANISTSDISCIAEDNEGKIWIGTLQGIKVVYNPASVFNQQVYAQNILTTQLGYPQNLLEFEQITCIAVDGGNRKWIGTAKAGLFLMSPDGTEELLHLTEDNSPLYSNQINALEINPDNGEVYIGTSMGVLSYMGHATGGKEDYSEVKVFPNPVKNGYEGDIAVNGLMENSFCKITDAAGNLVWQGYAYGGRFIWGGKDYNGKKVATGVYFVFASDQTGAEKSVAKILIIN